MHVLQQDTRGQPWKYFLDAHPPSEEAYHQTCGSHWCQLSQQVKCLCTRVHPSALSLQVELCADWHSVFTRPGDPVPFSPEGFTRRLVKWVVRNNHPFSVVDEADFREMLAMANYDIAVPSATTIKREIVKCYHEEAARIRERLASVDSKISLTLDCWTSPNGLAFLGVTGHYIDAQWTPRELVLDFLPLHGAHTGENLRKALVGVCDRAGILPKLLCVTSDNASNMDKLFVEFEDACKDRGIVFNKKEQHVRCILHVLNLSVQTLLRELKAEALSDGADLDSDAAAQYGQLSCIAKLRSVIIKIRNSPQRRHEFRGQCEGCHVSKKELLLDVRTRWGSTHAMLERAYELRQPLSKMALLNPDLPELSDEEWNIVEVTIQLLVLCGAADATATVRLSRWLSRSSAASQKPFHCYLPPAIPR